MHSVYFARYFPRIIQRLDNDIMFNETTWWVI